MASSVFDVTFFNGEKSSLMYGAGELTSLPARVNNNFAQDIDIAGFPMPGVTFSKEEAIQIVQVSAIVMARTVEPLSIRVPGEEDIRWPGLTSRRYSSAFSIHLKLYLFLKQLLCKMGSMLILLILIGLMFL